MREEGFKDVKYASSEGVQRIHLHGPIDIDQSWGKTRVATASRSTLKPMASCTERVAIYKYFISLINPEKRGRVPTMTAGSFVLILDNSGTSFCVRLDCCVVINYQSL